MSEFFALNPVGIEHLMAKDGEIAKYLHRVAEPVLETMKADVGHDTGQLAASLGIEVRETGSGANRKLEARVGVRADANARSGDTATNSELLAFEEHGTGHEPARHVSSQALHSAHG